MGLISSLAKVGIAKKLYDEARKPENQRRIKQAVSSFSDKRSARRTRRSH